MTHMPNLRLIVVAAAVFFGASFSAQAMERKVYSISLEKAVTQAIKNNFDIELRRIQTKVARERTISAESEFDPSLGAGANYTKNRTASTSAFADPEVSENDAVDGEVYVNGRITSGAEYKLGMDARQDYTNSSFQSINPSYQASLKMELSQPLLKDLGPEVNKWMITTSRNNEEVSRRRLEEGLSDVITQVHEVYWELVFRVENLKAQKESLERARDLERKVRIQVDVGAMSPIEIVQAEASVAERERMVIEADNIVDKVADQLLRLINPTEGDDIWECRLNPTDIPEMTYPTISMDKSIAEALNKRPEFQAARIEQENSNVELVYRKNQEWPSLDVVASLSLNGVRGEAQATTSFSGGGTSYSSFGGDWGDTFSDAASGEYYDYVVGLRLTYPIGSRGAKARAAEAALNVQSALLKLKSLEKDIILEVRDAAREIENGKKQVEAARLARVLAEKKLEAEVRKFEVGASTSFNVLEYQKDLIAQQSEELRAMAESRKAVARYYRAIGKALEYNSIDHN